LGALTNVASAVFIEPSIADQLKLYWLGTGYDFEKGIMSRTDFNCMMDQQAVDILLHSEVELHIIPHNVALAMEFSYAECEANMRGKHGLGDFLCDRWYQHLDGLRVKRWIWDLGIVGAMIHPEWAKSVEITTSKDNGSRVIHYYQQVDGEKIKADFFQTLDDWWGE
ncbi:MAG: nucleoside hydrolase, partial [Bacteroidota bacterium]